MKLIKIKKSKNLFILRAWAKKDKIENPQHFYKFYKKGDDYILEVYEKIEN